MNGYFEHGRHRPRHGSALHSDVPGRGGVTIASAGPASRPEITADALVRALFIGRVAGGPMEPRAEIRLIAGTGIEGDRYAVSEGTFGRRRGGKGLALTLVEEEAVAAARREYGIDLNFETTRRNVVTSGVRLEALVGEEFEIGSAVVRGVALNPPCSRLEKLAGIRGLKRAMAGAGGIRADVIEGGPVRAGDPLVVPARGRRRT